MGYVPAHKVKDLQDVVKIKENQVKAVNDLCTELTKDLERLTAEHELLKMSMQLSNEDIGLLSTRSPFTATHPQTVKEMYKAIMAFCNEEFVRLKATRNE
jgi:hypothetical protein